MRARDLTKGNIAYHDTLNPEVWKGDELRVDVRYKLLEIAKRFIEYLEVPDFKLEDIILRGSLVNYNYTQYSDFDLHIVTDFTAIKGDITEAFYLAKKKIWNDEHDITIKGHEVEIYVEDKDAKNTSEGTYSVLDARWLRTPKYQQPDIDDRAVSAKARDLMTQINRAVRAGSVEDIQRLQDKIRNMRQAGLDAGGEFSTENLAFKIIRNKKFLDKLYKTKNSKVDQELSLDEGVKSNALIGALVAALSLPAKADYNYPNTQPEVSPAAQALGIFRKINKMQRYGQAGFEAEMQQELSNIMRSIQGHPNQSKIYPIIKDIIKSPDINVEPQLPPLQEPEQSVNERKKAKKKKSKRRRPAGGYYGYYWGGYHDNSDSGDDGGGGESMYESQARLDPEVEEFLDGLTPDDVGYDEVGDYIVHYEGFTDQCQDSEEYQNDPESVFNDVWSDFKRRMGDRDPVNYGIVGEHDYPIVYSVFRKSELEEGWKQNLAAAGLGTALALGGTGAQANPDPNSPTWDQVGTTMNLQAKSSEQWNDDTPVKDLYSDIQGPDRDGDYKIEIWNKDKLLKQLVTKNPQAAVNLLKQKYPWIITKVHK